MAGQRWYNQVQTQCDLYDKTAFVKKEQLWRDDSSVFGIYMLQVNSISGQNDFNLRLICNFFVSFYDNEYQI